jgi:hypothetical protein
MRAMLIFFITLIWFKASSQEVIRDWKDLSDKMILLEYIENEVYSQLKFKSTDPDTASNSEVQISHNSTNTKLIIRDKASFSGPDMPLVVINGYPVEHKEILIETTLADIKNVSIVKSTVQSSAIYGIRGQHGVILIEMNNRKWKKLKKEHYDR